jgi:hypothetical protein
MSAFPTIGFSSHGSPSRGARECVIDEEVEEEEIWSRLGLSGGARGGRGGTETSVVCVKGTGRDVKVGGMASADWEWLGTACGVGR